MDVLNILQLPQRSDCCSTWKITQKLIFFPLSAPQNYFKHLGIFYFIFPRT